MKIHLIDQDDEEQLDKACRFALSIDHILVKSPWPLYMVSNEGKPLGYFHVVTHAIIHPAMSHEATPRETHDMIREVKSRVGATGHTTAVMIPQDNKTFTEKMLEKLGFQSTGCVLYTAQPK